MLYLHDSVTKHYTYTIPQKFMYCYSVLHVFGLTGQLCLFVWLSYFYECNESTLTLFPARLVTILWIEEKLA